MSGGSSSGRERDKERDKAERHPLVHGSGGGGGGGGLNDRVGPSHSSSYIGHKCRLAALWALDLCVACVDIFLVLMGPVLAILASSLFSFIVYVYFTEVLPGLLISRGTIQAQAITLLGLWIVFNLFFNYFRAMFVGPGQPPAEMDGDTKAALIDDPEVVAPHTHRFCTKCNRIKPMRAHHCSICKCCVLKFDHHCPWINNCVGWRNLRHFFLFLFYLWSGCAFFLLTAAGDAVHALLGVMDSASFLIAVVLTFSAFIATSAFLGWNTYLIVTNQSTVEFSGAIFKRKGVPNPFDAGSLARNWFAVFGHAAGDGEASLSNLWWWMMPTTQPPPGNGLIYPLSKRGVSHIV